MRMSLHYYGQQLIGHGHGGLGVTAELLSCSTRFPPHSSPSVRPPSLVPLSLSLSLSLRPFLRLLRLLCTSVSAPPTLTSTLSIECERWDGRRGGAVAT